MSRVPDVLPVLSAGKHRSPRRGACFMELASYLAGERWSDHPACTHPLLAEVARNVNDRISDSDRAALAPLIPDVVGLTTDDPRAEVRIALHCAVTALPVAPAERQKAIAVGVLTCERVLEQLGDLDYGTQVRIRRALDSAPHAAEWARRFAERAGGRRTSVRRFRHSAAHDIVKLAARGAEQAATPERDDVLRRMLHGAIDICRALQPAVAPAALDPVRWREACALTV
ncbi:MAG TPA: hypothetical protein VNU26_05855 [Mycobacteriales bacterium]|nr:hypothetical protein [Mycobacteriales bacterium]